MVFVLDPLYLPLQFTLGLFLDACLSQPTSTWITWPWVLARALRLRGKKWWVIYSLSFLPWKYVCPSPCSLYLKAAIEVIPAYDFNVCISKVIFVVILWGLRSYFCSFYTCKTSIYIRKCPQAGVAVHTLITILIYTANLKSLLIANQGFYLHCKFETQNTVFSFLIRKARQHPNICET